MAARLESTTYRGDDLPQKMARTMWLPLAGMGLMAVAVGLATGISAGVKLDDFFAGSGARDLKDATTTMAWTGGIVFLGMGLILSSITMVLVNIIRTLRDTGRDVQRAVGASEITQLRKPLTGTFIPHVMAMGLMTVVAGLVVGVVQATRLDGIPASGIANPATLRGQDLADFGTAQAFGTWVQPLRLFGLALIFTSIILALQTIIKGIGFQGQRVEELATGGRRWSSSVTPAPVVVHTAASTDGYTYSNGQHFTHGHEAPTTRTSPGVGFHRTPPRF